MLTDDHCGDNVNPTSSNRLILCNCFYKKTLYSLNWLFFFERGGNSAACTEQRSQFDVGYSLLLITIPRQEYLSYYLSFSMRVSNNNPYCRGCPYTNMWMLPLFCTSLRMTACLCLWPRSMRYWWNPSRHTPLHTHTHTRCPLNHPIMPSKTPVTNASWSSVTNKKSLETDRLLCSSDLLSGVSHPLPPSPFTLITFPFPSLNFFSLVSVSLLTVPLLFSFPYSVVKV